MGSLTINAYNRRESFGLGWADQWDYKFNDEKLAVNRAAKDKKAAAEKMGEINKKVLAAASNGAVKAKTGAHKLKKGTSTGIKWLKKQCGHKALK